MADGGDPPRHGAGRGRGEGGDPPTTPTVGLPLQLKQLISIGRGMYMKTTKHLVKGPPYYWGTLC